MNSHTDAVDSQVTQSGYELRRYVIRVTLNGEFLKVFKADYRVYGRDDLTKLLRSETRRGSTSEIDGADGGIGQVSGAQFQFAADGLYITCGFLLTHSREEAAVYTAFGTERYMYVYTGQGVRS